MSSSAECEQSLLSGLWRIKGSPDGKVMCKPFGVGLIILLAPPFLSEATMAAWNNVLEQLRQRMPYWPREGQGDSCSRRGTQGQTHGDAWEFMITGESQPSGEQTHSTKNGVGTMGYPLKNKNESLSSSRSIRKHEFQVDSEVAYKKETSKTFRRKYRRTIFIILGWKRPL